MQWRALPRGQQELLEGQLGANKVARLKRHVAQPEQHPFEAVDLREAVESKQWICGRRPSCPMSFTVTIRPAATGFTTKL